MNKKNLLTKIASIATELDYKGFEKEAKQIDTILLKMAQDINVEPNLNPTEEAWYYMDNVQNQLKTFIMDGGDSFKDFVLFMGPKFIEEAKSRGVNLLDPRIDFDALDESMRDLAAYYGTMIGRK